MTITRRAVISVLLLACLCTLPAHAQDDPAAGKQWYKGNLHTHSLWSDGNDFPEMITAWYLDHGYHFVALSDHNILAKGEKWMNIRDVNRRGGALGLARYKERFGDDWVETRTADIVENGETIKDVVHVRLKTLEEYRPKLEKPGRFILIQGEEITDRFGRLPVHMNATNIQELIRPQGGDSVRDVIRRNLRAVKEQSQRLNTPMIVHLNHPNFGWAVTAEDLAHVIEEEYFEVYNGHPGVRQLGDATHASVERMWDIANTLRIKKLNAPPLYGLATDDSHNYFGQRGASPGRGWVMVRAAALTPEALIGAMRRGDFYGSSGVTLRDVRFDGVGTNTLHVEVEPAEGATYTIHFIGTRTGADIEGTPIAGEDGKPLPVTMKYSDEIGEVLASIEGTKAQYKLKGDELYVRALITSSLPPENPVWEGQKRQAWTQPVGWEKWLKE